MKRLLEFLQEENGQFSITRLSILSILVTYISWGSYIVAIEKKIPDLPPQVVFLLIGLYGFNTSNINLNWGNGNNDKA